MEIIVLGSNGPYPSKNGACAAYLIRENGKNIVIDMGPGVLASLQNYIKPWEIDLLILTHLHYDHFSDIFSLKYSLDIAKFFGERTTPLKVYLPEVPEKERNLISFESVIETNNLSEATKLNIDNLSFEFFRTNHPIPCYGIVLRKGQDKVCFSSDTADFSQLEDYNKGAKLFFCEAVYYQEDVEKGYPNHMSSMEAAFRAKNGIVDKLLLTHIHPEVDKERLLKEAKDIFHNVQIINIGDKFTL
jgi:ribonuclease BN (tRNA processing enzyme)